MQLVTGKFIFETHQINNSLQIIADKRIPDVAKTSLEKYGHVHYFQTEGITYPAVSGHPDIFFCKIGSELICATNTPRQFKNNLSFAIEGKNRVGKKYPETASYNAVVTDKFLIHNNQFTDPVIFKKCVPLERIHVNQAYTRCNLIPLANNRFITSDKGIEKVLLERGLDVFYVNPEGILLPGFNHGFIGGTCGIYHDKIFFLGSLDHFPQGEKIREFLSGYKIIELYDGPLFDGGSLIFIED